MSTQVFLSDQNIFGKTFEYWIAHFWRTFDYVKDDKRLEKPVFPLHGLIPERQTEQRRTDYDIPQDKAILMSPMCFCKGIRRDADQNSKDMLKYYVQEKMKIIGDLSCNLDGKSVVDQLVKVDTGLFNYPFESGLLAKGVAACSGYWLFLKPNSLEKGLHILDTYGTCSRRETKVPMHFKVNIV